MKIKVEPSIVQMEDGSVTAWSHHDNKPQSTIRQLLKPVLLSMAICGCHTYNPGLVKSGRQRSNGRLCQIFGITYRTLIGLICMYACANSVAAFRTGPSELVHFNIIVLGWHMQCLTFFILSLKSNHVKHGGQRKAFDLWDDAINLSLDSLGIEVPEKKIKRRQKIYLFIAASVCIFNSVGGVLLATGVLSKDYSGVYLSHYNMHLALMIITAAFVQTNATLIWILPMCYMVQLSTVLITTFEVFNAFLDSHIKNNSIRMTCTFHKIKQLHLHLCQMVTHLDQDFRWYFATIFSYSVCISCFILYIILKVNLDVLDYVMFCFWLLTLLTILGTVSVFAAIVNDKVSEGPIGDPKGVGGGVGTLPDGYMYIFP